VPTADGIDLKAVAERTPGFVAADLVAVRREAAVTAALRHGAGPAASAGTDTVEEPARVTQQDLLDAVGAVRPISMSSSASLQTGGITLDQVGDMVEVKQALTEACCGRCAIPTRSPGSASTRRAACSCTARRGAARRSCSARSPGPGSSTSSP
jgi:hypothetical protein